MTLQVHYDFENNPSLTGHSNAPNLSLVRATTARYVDSAGVLQEAASGEARFAYNPVSLAFEGLQIEEASTNLCLQSEDFQTTWTATGVTITPASGTAPDGTNTFSDIHTDNTESVLQNITLAADQVHCASVFVKQGLTGSHDWVKLILRSASVATGVEAWFNIATGAAGTLQAITGGASPLESDLDSGIEDWGNGIYRIWVTCTLGGGLTNGRMQFFNTVSDGSNTREATDTVLYWGAQVEQHNHPTSYIPTTTTSVARNKDDVSTSSITGVNTQLGSIFFSGKIPFDNDSNNFGPRIDDGTSNNIIRWLRASTNFPNFSSLTTATNEFQIIGASLSSGAFFRHSGAWDANDCAAYRDGSSEGTDSTYDAPDVDLTRLYIGSNAASSHFNGFIKELAFWDERLDNATLMGLSNGSISIGSNPRTLVRSLTRDLVRGLSRNLSG